MTASAASATGIETLKRLEGFRAKAYLDSVGVATIGYGTTEGVQLGDTITEAEAERRLRSDVRNIELALSRLVKVPVSQPQFDALVCFVYNVGIHAFSKSTALRALNAERYDDVDDEMRRWVYGTERSTGEKVKIEGLIRRRMVESELWLSALPPAVDPLPRPLVSAGADVSMNPVGEPAPRQSQPAQLAASAVTGVGVAGAALSDTAQTIAPAASAAPSLQALFVGLAIGGVMLTVWAAMRRGR